MKKILITTLLALSVAVAGAAERKRQLLIFVGEGNMFGVNAEKKVLPVLKREKSLQGQDLKVAWHVRNYLPTSFLDAAWKPAENGNKKAVKVKQAGAEYPRFLTNVKRVAGQNKFETVVLYWYQGQSDARNGHGAEYTDSVKRVVSRLEKDLGLGEIKVVLTRLTDSKQELQRHADWKVVREAQTDLVKKNLKWKLVNTDDFNGVSNDLRLNSKGFKELNEQYAQHALDFITKKN